MRKASQRLCYEPFPKQVRDNTTSLRLLSVAEVAVWTGLEPATPCVTGMYSNQLNYQTKN